MADLRIVGITDEQTVCDKCGKIELRSTVILAEDGIEAGRYGSTCAAKIMTAHNGVKVTGVLTTARKVEAVRRNRVREECAAIHRLLNAGDAESLARANRSRALLKRDVPLVRPDEIEFERKALAYIKAVRMDGETRTWKDFRAA